MNHALQLMAQHPALAYGASRHAPSRRLLEHLDQYVENLRQLNAIGLDVGNKDALVPAAQKLDDALTSYGIAHQFEIYDGNHVDHVADRIELKVVPFFSRNLSFEQNRR